MDVLNRAEMSGGPQLGDRPQRHRRSVQRAGEWSTGHGPGRSTPPRAELDEAVARHSGGRRPVAGVGLSRPHGRILRAESPAGGVRSPRCLRSETVDCGGGDQAVFIHVHGGPARPSRWHLICLPDTGLTACGLRALVGELRQLWRETPEDGRCRTCADRVSV